mgnify:CR=1 FL=1
MQAENAIEVKNVTKTFRIYKVFKRIRTEDSTVYGDCE